MDSLEWTPDVSKLFEIDPLSKQYELAIATIVKRFCAIRGKAIATEGGLDSLTDRYDDLPRLL